MGKKIVDLKGKGKKFLVKENNYGCVSKDFFGF
jgi:hypothetical protein